MDNNTLTALVLAALDDSAIKALNERINELAELGFKPEIVTELPEEGNDHTLYLVLESEPGEDPWYQEYLWLDNEWEKIGTTSIDFENYYTKDEADATFVPKVIEDGSTTVEIYNDETGIVLGMYGDDVNNSIELSANGSLLDASGEQGESAAIHVNSVGSVTVEAQNLEDGGFIDIHTIGADGNDSEIELGTGELTLTATDDSQNETSIQIDGNNGTIILDAPNGVQVPTPVNNTDASTKGYTDTAISTALQNYYTKSQTYNKTEVDQLVEEVGRQLFDGTSEEWDALTEEEKVAFVIAAVEDYVELNIADTYNVNEALGNVDPQETIVSDLYEDEAIDLTNQIIGGE